MKIAFVSQPWNRVEPPVERGSLAIWTYQVARRLAASNEVIVYARGHDRVRAAVRRHERVTYRYIPSGLDTMLNRAHALLWKVLAYLPIWPEESRSPRFASVFYHLGYILSVALDLRKQQCDLVHIWNFPQFVSVIRMFNPGIKIVLHMQCEWLTQLDHQLMERHLRHADLVIGCSDFISNNARTSFPQYADRCVTVYNGVDVNRFDGAADMERAEGSDDTLQLLFVGRVSPEKGVHVLVDALAELAPAYPKLHLTIIGPKGSMPGEFVLGLSKDPLTQNLAQFFSGDYFSYLERKIAAIGPDRVTFTDHVPNSQLADYYTAADVFLFPSVWEEPFGMPPTEAMAAGVPVVATRVGGIVETVVDGETGFLVEPDNAHALAEAIRVLLDDGDLRRRMGEAGRNRGRTLFSWDEITQALLNQYQGLLSDGSSKRTEESVVHEH